MNFFDSNTIKLHRWLVGCRFKSNCPLAEPATIDGMPSMGVFLRDPNPYLRKFRRKPRKTPNGYKVDKRDRESNSPPPVYQF